MLHGMREEGLTDLTEHSEDEILKVRLIDLSERGRAAQTIR